MLFFYWVFLSCLAFVTGAFALRVFITTPLGTDACLRKGHKRSLGSSAAYTIYAVSLAALITHTMHILLHAHVMTDTSFSEFFSVIPVFLTQTKYGKVTLIRSVFLAAIVLAAYFAAKRNSKGATSFGIILSIAVITTLSMSGHQGVKGYLTLPFFLDLFHSIAAYLWVGGLFFIRLSFSFLLKLSCVELWDPFIKLINRFSKLATVCAFTVLILGTGLGFFHAQGLDISKITSTFYGLVFLFKLFNIGILFMLGGINKFFILPMLNKTDRGDWARLTRLNERLVILVTVEVFIGLVILLTTGLLTHLSPQE